MCRTNKYIPTTCDLFIFFKSESDTSETRRTKLHWNRPKIQDAQMFFLWPSRLVEWKISVRKTDCASCVVWSNWKASPIFLWWLKRVNIPWNCLTKPLKYSGVEMSKNWNSYVFKFVKFASKSLRKEGLDGQKMGYLVSIDSDFYSIIYSVSLSLIYAFCLVWRFDCKRCYCIYFWTSASALNKFILPCRPMQARHSYTCDAIIKQI